MDIEIKYFKECRNKHKRYLHDIVEFKICCACQSTKHKKLLNLTSLKSGTSSK